MMQYLLAFITLIVVYAVPTAIVCWLVGQREDIGRDVLRAEPRPTPPAEGQVADRQA